MKSPEVWARSSDREGGKESRWREGLGEGEGLRECDGERETERERENRVEEERRSGRRSGSFLRLSG